VFNLQGVQFRTVGRVAFSDLLTQALHTFEPWINRSEKAILPIVRNRTLCKFDGILQGLESMFLDIFSGLIRGNFLDLEKWIF
jgi:hypothetical protein